MDFLKLTTIPAKSRSHLTVKITYFVSAPCQLACIKVTSQMGYTLFYKTYRLNMSPWVLHPDVFLCIGQCSLYLYQNIEPAGQTMQICTLSWHIADPVLMHLDRLSNELFCVHSVTLSHIEAPSSNFAEIITMTKLYVMCKTWVTSRSLLLKIEKNWFWSMILPNMEIFCYVLMKGITIAWWYVQTSMFVCQGHRS